MNKKSIFLCAVLLLIVLIGASVYYLRHIKGYILFNDNFVKTEIVSGDGISLRDFGNSRACCTYNYNYEPKYEIIPPGPPANNVQRFIVTQIPGTSDHFGFYYPEGYSPIKGMGMVLDQQKEVTKKIQIFDQYANIDNIEFVNRDTVIFQYNLYREGSQPFVEKISQFNVSSNVLKGLTSEADNSEPFRVLRYDENTSILVYTTGEAPGIYWESLHPRDTHVVYFGEKYPEGVDILTINHGMKNPGQNGLTGYSWKNEREFYLRVSVGDIQKIYQVTF